ncbi:MAG: LuxR C-terminal-related transcriptional regulator [Treponemataceae bacterium]
MAAIAAVAVGSITNILLDAPDEISVRLRTHEQTAQRIGVELAALEGLSYQFIANQDLNDSVYAYGKRENRYDVALYNLSFTRHIESQRIAGSLLEEAFFLDYDEAARIPLTMTEDFLRPEIAEVRRFVWDRALKADGVYVWMDRTLSVHREQYLIGARLIKRLKTGEPIGVLALLVNSRRTAELISTTMSGKGEPKTREICFLVSSVGNVLSTTDTAMTGKPSPDTVDTSYFESIQPQEQNSGRFDFLIEGRKTASVYTRIRQEGPYLITAYPGVNGFGPLRRIFVSALFAAAAGAAVWFGGRRTRPDGIDLPPDLPPLNERELKLLTLLARGLSNKEIAYEFGIKEQTVKNYLRPLYDKLGVHDRVSALLKLRGDRPSDQENKST